jgi:hypothetical protein
VASMDVFKGDAFSMMSLLAAIENVDFKPQFLGSLGIFEDAPQRTRVVAVESRDNALSLIQTSAIGAPPAQLVKDKAKLRNFNTVRLAKESVIYADEVQGIRAFGSESELKQVQMEVARRYNQLVNDMELTWEYHRLGAVQGIVLDADASTLVNFYTEFGVSQPTEVAFAFGSLTDGQVRKKIEGSIVRPLIRACKGAFNTGSGIVALCGDDFWDAFVNHSEVRATYLASIAAAQLREGTVFSTFQYAGVTWVNYRGTDDGTTVAIGATKAKFFPVRAPGIFKTAWGPGESFDTVNQPGVPLRPMILPDPSGRNAFVSVELYSYPLFICTRPQVLYRASST